MNSEYEAAESINVDVEDVEPAIGIYARGVCLRLSRRMFGGTLCENKGGNLGTGSPTLSDPYGRGPRSAAVSGQR